MLFIVPVHVRSVFIKGRKSPFLRIRHVLVVYSSGHVSGVLLVVKYSQRHFECATWLFNAACWDVNDKLNRIYKSASVLRYEASYFLQAKFISRSLCQAPLTVCRKASKLVETCTNLSECDQTTVSLRRLVYTMPKLRKSVERRRELNLSSRILTRHRKAEYDPPPPTQGCPTQPRRTPKKLNTTQKSHVNYKQTKKREKETKNWGRDNERRKDEGEGRERKTGCPECFHDAPQPLQTTSWLLPQVTPPLFPFTPFSMQHPLTSYTHGLSCSQFR